MDLKQLYQDIILEHGKSPRNFGKCIGHNHEAKGHNPLCGDQVQVYLKLNKEKKVEDISFEGEGCAISIASASIMTETMKGKEFNEERGKLSKPFFQSPRHWDIEFYMGGGGKNTFLSL